MSKHILYAQLVVEPWLEMPKKSHPLNPCPNTSSESSDEAFMYRQLYKK